MFLVILVNKNASEKEQLKALKQVILLHWFMCLFQTKRWLNDNWELAEQNYLHITLKMSTRFSPRSSNSANLSFKLRHSTYRQSFACEDKHSMTQYGILSRPVRFCARGTLQDTRGLPASSSSEF